MRQRVPFSHVFTAPVGTESISFDLHESEQYLACAERDQKQKRLSVFLISRWILILGAGVCTGVTGAFIDFSLEKIIEARFGIVQVLVDDGWNPAVLTLVHVSLCTFLGSLAGLLVCFVAPLAAGSGIPEVKSRLNGVDLPDVVAPRTYLAKAVGVLFSVAAGLPCGKEGPMIHSGAILAAMFSSLGLKLFPEQYQWETESRDLITAGAAAGVAAAFGAPLGGVLFAMEEGSSFWNTRVLLRSFVCASVCALVLNFFVVGFSAALPWGSLGALGVLTFGSFLENKSMSYHTWELPLFILIGLLGGLVGALFNGLNIQLTLWRMRNVPLRGTRRFLEVIGVTAAIAMLAFIVPLWTGSCYVPSVNSHDRQAWITCSPDSPEHGRSFTATVGLFVTPSEDSIKVLFHDPHKFDVGMLLGFAVMYFFTACWTYGLGVPSGLFVPSLLTGAALGRICGQVLQEAGADISHPGTYALIGAAAALAGMARITISLAVILVEATGDTQWALPVLFTVMASKWAGDFFNRGLYDIHIGLKHVPVLEPFAEHDMKHMRACDVMTRDVVTLEQVVKVRDLLQTLENCNHQGFPVVRTGTRNLCGMVQRSTLHHVLRYGREHGLLHGCGSQARPLAVPAMLPYGEVARRQRETPSLDEVHEALIPEDLDACLDLIPYTDCAALHVHEHTTLRRTYMLFRTVGLRHLPVVGEGGVAGIITRKELILAPGVDGVMEGAPNDSQGVNAGGAQSLPGDVEAPMSMTSTTHGDSHTHGQEPNTET